MLLRSRQAEDEAARQTYRLVPNAQDVLTETYNMPFYLQYLARWPEYYVVQEAPASV